MMRFTLRCFIILFALLATCYYGLFYTVTGTRLILKYAKPYIPSELTYKRYEGALHSGLTFSQVTYQYNNQIIPIEKATVKARLRLARHPIAWQVNLSSGKQSLSQLLPDMVGDIKTKLHIEGIAGITGYVAGSATIDELSGTLYDQPLHGEGTIQFNPAYIIINHLIFTSGKNYINIDGTLKNKWDLNWKIHIPELAAILNSGKGKITGQGKLIGTQKMPRFRGELHLSNIAYDQYSIEHLDVQSAVTTKKSETHLNGKNIQISEYMINALSLDGTTIKGKQQLSGQINTEKTTADFGIAGQGNAQNWQGQLQSLTIDSAQAGKWALEKSASIIKKPSQLSVDKLCFTQGKGKVCFNLKESKDNQWLLDIIFNNLAFNLVDNTKTPLSGKLSVKTQLDPSAVSGSWRKQPLNAEITGELNNLAFVSLFMPEISHVKGKLQTHWIVKGTPEKPLLSGNSTITHGQLTIPKTGTTLEKINLTLKSQELNQVNYQGTATAGQGQLNFKGSTNWSDGFKTNLALTGTNALIYNTSIAKITANPNITIRWEDTNISTTGTVMIPTAVITPKDYRNTVTLSEDVVFAKDLNGHERWHTKTDINLTLGNHVLITYLGLNAQLAGSVNLKDSTNRATTASGQLYVKKGRYIAYGQNLNIEHGQLLFTGGPITNPGLSIQASKAVGTVTESSNTLTGRKGYISTDTKVGVRVHGTIKSPELTLFSEPSGLSQSQVLSNLVLGKSLDQVDNNTDLLFNAMSGLGLNPTQGKMLKEQLQHSLGLDELSIQSGETYDPKQQAVVQNTSLTLGKRLSPRLLLSYSVGLMQPINILNITYQINKKWLLRSQTDLDSSGIDLMYSIETD